MVVLFLLFFSFMGEILHSSIHLSCENILHEQSDNKDSILPTALVGNPFTIKIVTKGSVGTLKNLQLPESCNIISSSRSTSINMTGNHVSSSATYSFDVIANKEGMIRIGPITVDAISSNSMELYIRRPTDIDNQTEAQDEQETHQGHESPHPEMFARIHTEKTVAYLGEPFIFSRVIYHRGNIRKTEYEDVTSAQALIKKLPGSIERVEVIKGNKYNVVEEQFLITATKPGKIIIPAQQFIYLFTPRQQQKNNRDPFQMFLHAFSPFELHQEKGVVPETTFSVKKLPEQIKNVDAIGVFTHYNLTIDPPSTHVHDTIQATIRLEGFGNFDEIPTPDIIIPDSCNRYAPTQKMIQEITSTNKHGIKEFSITLQPTQAGDFIIPEQIFSFFNPKTQRVEKIRTKKISCSVLQKKGAPLVKKNSPSPTEPDADSIKEKKLDDSSSKEKNIIFDLNTPLKSKKIPYIPWMLFIFALFAPFISIRRKIYDFFIYSKKQSDTELILSELEKALIKREYAHAHKLIKKIFGQISKQPETFITETVIEQILTTKSCFLSEINLIKEIYIQTLVNDSQKKIKPQYITKGIQIIKKLFVLFFFILNVTTVSNCSVKQDDLAKQGFSHIKLGKLEEAHTLLTSIDKKTPLILKNIADVAFNLEKNHDALFWYGAMQKQLATFEMRNHAYIITQKRVLYKKIDPTISKYKHLFFTIQDAFASTPLSLWQIVFLLIWIIALLNLLEQKRIKKQFLIYIISASFLLYFSANLQYKNETLTFKGTSYLYSGPDKTYDIITELGQQSLCQIIETGSYFYKIKHKKTTGWISKKDLFLP